jgi:hypothetical protein
MSNLASFDLLLLPIDNAGGSVANVSSLLGNDKSTCARFVSYSFVCVEHCSVSHFTLLSIAIVYAHIALIFVDLNDRRALCTRFFTLRPVAVFSAFF